MTGELPGGDAVAPGRVARWRSNADRAYASYQERAKRQPVLGLPLAFLARYSARQGMLLASAAAFRLFLWLLPLALLSAGILARVADNHGTTIESASKKAGLTGVAAQQVESALIDGQRSWLAAVILGSVLFIWGTRTLIRNLVVVNAHVWDAAVPRRRQKEVLKTTLLFAGTWVVMFAFVAVLHRVDLDITGGVLFVIVIEGSLVSALWLMICLRLPDRRHDWLDLLPGALLFGFGLTAMNTVGRVYLPARLAHSSAMYGSLGIASAMLLWLLLIGELIVSGALASAVWSDYRSERRGEG